MNKGGQMPTIFIFIYYFLNKATKGIKNDMNYVILDIEIVKISIEIIDDLKIQVVADEILDLLGKLQTTTTLKIDCGKYLSPVEIPEHLCQLHRSLAFQIEKTPQRYF